MAVTAYWFGTTLKNQFSATSGNRTDWIGNTIKGTLHTVTWTPLQDTHDFADDATNELSTAGGYTAGGITLAGKALTYVGASNEVQLDANDLVWSSSTFTARHCAITNTTPGTAATNPLMGVVDFGADAVVSAGTFTITWDSTGVMKITAA